MVKVLKNSIVLVFLKEPVPGRVKTRLARGFADEGLSEPEMRAAATYRLLVSAVLADLPANHLVGICFDPPDSGARDRIATWLQADLARFDEDALWIPQVSGDLGDRLWAATDEAFCQGAKTVFLIGTDCPGITGEVVCQAEEALASHEVVFGPTHDGGYFLLGLRRDSGEANRALFEKIPWSTENTLQVSIGSAEKAGLSVAQLAIREDVDDVESLRRVAPQLEGD